MKKVLAFLLVVLLLGLTACSRGGTLRLGTGDQGGNYYAYGNALAALTEKGKITVKNTAGTAANIRLIHEQFLDMAIVQSDVLNDAYHGTGSYKEAIQGYSVVAGLYTETCQIVVPAQSTIQSVADLQGKKVSVGELESGTLENATQILSVAGLKLTDVQASHLSFTDSAEALKKGEIDAFFCTALVGMHVLEELTAEMEIRLIALDDAQTTRLMKNYSGYTLTTVPAETYNGQHEDVHTVGVKAVLIAKNDVKNEKVAEVLTLLFDKGEDLQKACKLDQAITPEFATEDIPVPFHAGTKDYYANLGIQVNTDSAEGNKAPVVGQDD